MPRRLRQVDQVSFRVRFSTAPFAFTVDNLLLVFNSILQVLWESFR